jgi:hypothetical protein
MVVDCRSPAYSARGFISHPAMRLRPARTERDDRSDTPDVKIAIFLAYCILFAAILVVTNRISKRLGERSNWIPGEELSLIGQLLSVVLPLVVLAGFFDAAFFGLYFAALNLGLAVTLLFRAFLPEITGDMKALRRWSDFEFNSRHPFILSVLRDLLFLTITGELVALAAVLASHERPSDGLTRAVLAVNLAAYLLLFPVWRYMGVGRLVSPVVDDATRTHDLIYWIAQVIPLTLNIALLSWALTSGARRGLAIGQLGFVVSLPLVLIILTVFALTVALPYALGVTRAKRLRAGLLATQHELMVTLARGLEIPSTTAQREQVEAIHEKLLSARMELQRNHRLLVVGAGLSGPPDVALEPPPLPQLPRKIAESAGKKLSAEAFNADPRGEHLRELSMIDEIVNKADLDIARKRSDAAKLKAAAAWANLARQRASDIQGTIDAVNKGRPPLTSVFALLGAPILSILIEQAGKALWTIISTGG